jgi:hypothetical protein
MADGQGGETRENPPTPDDDEREDPVDDDPGDGDDDGESDGDGDEDRARDRHTVPFERFDQVNEEKKKLQRQNAQLLAKLARKARQSEAPDGANSDAEDILEELPAPPTTLSERQKIHFYVREGLRRQIKPILEKLLGSEIDQVKAALAQAPTAAGHAAEAQYRDLCEQVGLDSKNTVVRAAFRAMYAENSEELEPIDILKTIKGQIGGKPGSSDDPPRRTVRALSSGSTPATGIEKIFPRDKRHATELAMKGKKVPFFGVEEIFSNADKRRDRGRRK